MKFRIPRIQLHFSSDTTGRSGGAVLSWRKILFWIAVVLFAMVGFLSFQPEKVVTLLSDTGLWRVYRDNKEMAKTVEGVKQQYDAALEKIEGAGSLRKEVEVLADLSQPDVAQSKSKELKEEFDRKNPNRYLDQLRDAHRDFRQFLSILKENPELGASLPINHPMIDHRIVLQGWEMVKDPFTGQELPHKGIDYAGKVGDTVYATGAGIVEEARNLSGWGLSVTVRHTKKITTFHAHLDKMLVQDGQKVKRGQAIGLLGATGRTSGPHLHYEVRVFGQPVNPHDYYLTR